MKLTCLGAVINLVDLDPAFTYHLSKVFCKEALLVFEKDKFFYLKIVCLPLVSPCTDLFMLSSNFKLYTVC